MRSNCRRPERTACLLLQAIDKEPEAVLRALCVLHAAIMEIGAAAVVGQGPDGPIASQVPIELDPEPAPKDTLRCHFARPDPQALCVADGRELLLIFQGPQGYVSPNWYPTKRETGRVVPSWS